MCSRNKTEHWNVKQLFAFKNYSPAIEALFWLTNDFHWLNACHYWEATSCLLYSQWVKLLNFFALQNLLHCHWEQTNDEVSYKKTEQAYFKFNASSNSLIKSHFPDESINLNFPLALRYFANITKAWIAHYWKKTLRRHWPKKEKKNIKLISPWYSILWKFKVVDSLALFQIT